MRKSILLISLSIFINPIQVIAGDDINNLCNEEYEYYKCIEILKKLPPMQELPYVDQNKPISIKVIPYGENPRKETRANSTINCNGKNCRNANSRRKRNWVSSEYVYQESWEQP